tara:strand:- start:77463 stop:78128 length:666 start_codon:yes stop_codon:yes gene_type:complete
MKASVYPVQEPIKSKDFSLDNFGPETQINSDFRCEMYRWETLEALIFSTIHNDFHSDEHTLCRVELSFKPVRMTMTARYGHIRSEMDSNDFILEMVKVVFRKGVDNAVVMGFDLDKLELVDKPQEVEIRASRVDAICSSLRRKKAQLCRRRLYMQKAIAQVSHFVETISSGSVEYKPDPDFWANMSYEELAEFQTDPTKAERIGSRFYSKGSGKATVFDYT